MHSRHLGRPRVRGLGVLMVSLAWSSAAAQERVPVPDSAPAKAHTRTTQPGWGGPGGCPPSVPARVDEPAFAPWAGSLPSEGRHAVAPVGRDPYVLAFTGGEWAPARGADPRLLERARAEPLGHTWGYVMVRGRMADP